MEELSRLWVRFKKPDEKGFLMNVPMLEQKKHLSLGYDARSHKINIHITDDTKEHSDKSKYDFIYSISPFRFFLFIKRFGIYQSFAFLELLKSSKINKGRLRRHDLLLMPLEQKDIDIDKFVKRTKNNTKFRLRPDMDFEELYRRLEYVENLDIIAEGVHEAFSYKNGNLKKEGFVFQLSTFGGLYFIPRKKYYRFQRNMFVDMYRYMNSYPDPGTYGLRQLMHQRIIELVPTLKVEDS